jgi:transglutaminase-like putative cysteine protease
VRRPNHTLLATEVALWAVTAAAIVGMHRLFLDGSYRGPLLLEAIAAHVTVALLRRRGVRLVPAALATAAAAVLAMTWIHYAGTTTALVPTGDTWAAASADLRAAWRLFQDVDAPAPVDTGFLLAASAALWVMVFVADWAAFRANASFEALLPSATLFLFAAALGAPGGRVAGAAVYAAAAMLFILLQRTLTQEESSTWAASHRTRGRWSLLGTGSALIAVAVVVGAVTGPNLPGAEAGPAGAVIDWQNMNDDDDETRVVVSPMVDLRTRLVEQPNVELFTVRSNESAYWRLTSLDEFDGTIWRSSYGTNDADGSLPAAVDTDIETGVVRQTFSISNLAAVWVPAAWEPVAIDPGDNEVDWDERSSTLIVDKNLDTSDGFTYEVESHMPRWRDEDLRTASSEVPDDIAATYLDLPEVDGSVRDLATDLTADVSAPYDKALALQDYLRGPNYTYDIDAPKGHSSDALTEFLFDTRIGYCEQFAGAYAVMARLIGLPSRVTVGFTQGIRDSRDPSLYQVRGEHAHAWVEVYLDGFGWVIMDPTPGRAPPGAENWLGVPTQQDAAAGNGTEATTVPGSDPGQPPNVPAGGPSGDEQRAAVDLGQARNDGISNAGKDGAEVSDTMRIVMQVLLYGALAYLLLVPLAITTQHVARRRRARLPADRVRLAWADTVDRAVAFGTNLPASLTISESVERLTTALPGSAAAVHRVAAAMEHVVYAEVTPSADEADAAMAARDEIVEEISRREPLATRIGRYLHIRELWRRRPQRLRRTARTMPAPSMSH